jgi:hypothetical protein
MMAAIVDLFKSLFYERTGFSFGGILDFGNNYMVIPCPCGIDASLVGLYL